MTVQKPIVLFDGVHKAGQEIDAVRPIRDEAKVRVETLLADLFAQ